MPYPADQQAQIEEAAIVWLERGQDLVERYIIHRHVTARGAEYSIHGFSRRLKTLVECVERFFELIPLDFDRPGRSEINNATIYLQGFVLNIYGALDNLAHIWAAERALKKANGEPLPPAAIGLGPKFVRLRASLSVELREHLILTDDWFNYIEGYRHALAHRIPLYIPPICLNPRDSAEYERLKISKFEALRERNDALYDRLDDQQQALGRFQPVMMHSFGEEAPTVTIHPQMICDFSTVVDIGERVLQELEPNN